MKKKHKPNAAAKPVNEEKPATLKDLLGSETLSKLKAKAEELQSAELSRKEEERKQAEEARQAERKRLENDFAHLLDKSGMDWRKFK